MIRKLFTGVCLTILSLPVLSQGKINVQIGKFENNKGSCIVCLYDKAGDFSDKGKPLACTTVVISNKKTNAVFENITPGTYAILVIHDANNNQKFDTNFLGIPKEGYGASRNKLPMAAAPKFAENSFSLADGATIDCSIRLRYIF